MKFPTQLYGDYFISHDIRIPFLTNQDSMESRRVFFVAHLEDHPRTCFSGAIGPWWSLLSVPQGSGCGMPSKWPNFMAEINGGDPKHLLTGIPSSKYLNQMSEVVQKALGHYFHPNETKKRGFVHPRYDYPHLATTGEWWWGGGNREGWW